MAISAPWRTCSSELFAGWDSSWQVIVWVRKFLKRQPTCITRQDEIPEPTRPTGDLLSLGILHLEVLLILLRLSHREREMELREEEER